MGTLLLLNKLADAPLIAILLFLLLLNSTNAQHQDAIDQTKLSNLHSQIEKARINSGISGLAVAVLHKGKIIFAEGFGARNGKDPYRPETLAPIGSITKSFTAAAIGELVAVGKMDWDITPVSKYLPEFELEDPDLTLQLTVADLLSHRTGMPRHDLAWYKANITRIELIKRLKSVKLNRKLKAKTQYNSIMYAVVGEASARAAGTSWENLVEGRVVNPLGLKSTGFGQMAMKKRSTDHAIPVSAASFADALDGKYQLGDLDLVYPAAAPAGDMYSNVLDLVQYGQAILSSGQVNGTQVLNKESIKEILSGHTLDKSARRSPDFAPTLTYGFGWLIDSYKGRYLVYHGGVASSFASSLFMFPDDDLVIAVQSNMRYSSAMTKFLPYFIADEILALPKTEDWLFRLTQDIKASYETASKVFNGDFLPPKIKGKPTSRPLIEFAGQYIHPLYGTFIIELRSEPKSASTGSSLFFRFNQLDDKLEHYHYDTFKGVIKNSDLISVFLITFQQEADGSIISFIVELPDGPQSFVKVVNQP
ncbi:hypothetical protein BX616_007042 [Lobosporangium transversale]|uniref:Beta-lactamase/transpeptidase-like protein n=1 Tax=Lobosporangium transversale TaxID=64571 RepID=A0A1Y2GV31_9FUNG|nr:beta-lactamase/transpeptidase-like protein [Lobosporangium transversale]KAF9915036.1 hypothetical protein BX616_007042 [Lobosporangium transversale]ORZ21868.1 beta-lactamase/transpeptidase-like protein [Lobosporangium transversale]|eukprot:XP_021883119.1 beta-lactamase/transpeptidase-like protein [Lobosporangium transversale]